MEQQLKNVTVDKAANIYFDGKVTSRSVWLPDGSKITLGIMLPGEYEFGTDSLEVMDILSGDLKVLLPGETLWRKSAAAARSPCPPMLPSSWKSAA